MNQCELTHLERRVIDIAKAEAEHHAYEDCLRSLGLHVISLPAEPEYPDAMFVEDPALVLDECAIICRPGVASRRGETESIARALAPFRELRYMQSPATIDGGDVMLADKTFYVGLSGRTNVAAIEQLHAMVKPLGYSVQGAAVPGCLHLKSGVSWLGDETVLIHRPWVDPVAFRKLRMLDIPPGEEWGANVLLIGNTVLVAAGFPRTAELLDSIGRDVRVLDISELMKAESGLTCSSLIFRA